MRHKDSLGISLWVQWIVNFDEIEKRGFKVDEHHRSLQKSDGPREHYLDTEYWHFITVTLKDGWTREEGKPTSVDLEVYTVKKLE